jgi:hypothetical protein
MQTQNHETNYLTFANNVLPVPFFPLDFKDFNIACKNRRDRLATQSVLSKTMVAFLWVGLSKQEK